MHVLYAVLGTVGVYTPVAAVVFGYLGYRYGRRVELKANQAMLAAVEIGQQVKSAVAK